MEVIIMLRVLLTITAIISVIFIIACSGEQQSGSKAGSEEAQSENTAQIVVENGNAICPACKMEMKKSEMITYVSEGDTLYFCAEGCKKHYLAQAKKDEAK
jgi:YHS domain-containing protein